MIILLPGQYRCLEIFLNEWPRPLKVAKSFLNKETVITRGCDAILQATTQAVFRREQKAKTEQNVLSLCSCVYM